MIQFKTTKESQKFINQFNEKQRPKVVSYLVALGIDMVKNLGQPPGSKEIYRTISELAKNIGKGSKDKQYREQRDYRDYREYGDNREYRDYRDPRDPRESKSQKLIKPQDRYHHSPNMQQQQQQQQQHTWGSPEQQVWGDPWNESDVWTDTPKQQHPSWHYKPNVHRENQFQEPRVHHSYQPEYHSKTPPHYDEGYRQHHHYQNKLQTPFQSNRIQQSLRSPRLHHQSYAEYKPDQLTAKITESPPPPMMYINKMVVDARRHLDDHQIRELLYSQDERHSQKRHHQQYSPPIKYSIPVDNQRCSAQKQSTERVKPPPASAPQPKKKRSQPSHPLKRVPDYLKNVQSKIKNQVQQHRQQYQEQTHQQNTDQSYGRRLNAEPEQDPEDIDELFDNENIGVEKRETDEDRRVQEQPYVSRSYQENQNHYIQEPQKSYMQEPQRSYMQEPQRSYLQDPPRASQDHIRRSKPPSNPQVEYHESGNTPKYGQTAQFYAKNLPPQPRQHQTDQNIYDLQGYFIDNQKNYKQFSFSPVQEMNALAEEKRPRHLDEQDHEPRRLQYQNVSEFQQMNQSHGFQKPKTNQQTEHSPPFLQSSQKSSNFANSRTFQKDSASMAKRGITGDSSHKNYAPSYNDGDSSDSKSNFTPPGKEVREFFQKEFFHRQQP